MSGCPALGVAWLPQLHPAASEWSPIPPSSLSPTSNLPPGSVANLPTPPPSGPPPALRRPLVAPCRPHSPPSLQHDLSHITGMASLLGFKLSVAPHCSLSKGKTADRRFQGTPCPTNFLGIPYWATFLSSESQAPAIFHFPLARGPSHMLFPLPGVLFLPLLIWLPAHLPLQPHRCSPGGLLLTPRPAHSLALAQPPPVPSPRAAAGGQGQAG